MTGSLGGGSFAESLGGILQRSSFAGVSIRVPSYTGILDILDILDAARVNARVRLLLDNEENGGLFDENVIAAAL